MTELRRAEQFQRVIVCGSRQWTDRDLILAVLRDLVSIHGPYLLVAHGAAKGADALTDSCARQLHIQRMGMPAEWTLFGKPAGPQRNLLLLTLVDPHLVLAFRAHGESPGTDGMLVLCQEGGYTWQRYEPQFSWAQR